MTHIENVPTHVAIIPDGNRRWAKDRNLPTMEGHRRGYDNLVAITKKGRELGVKVITVWGFSTENWSRTQEEVGYLMGLFERWIDSYLQEAISDKVRITHLGRKDRMNKGLLNKIIDAEEKTKDFDNHRLNVALDYGGRDEIIRAIQKIQQGTAELTTENFSQYLDTAGIPDPDLIIRTGGEQRSSGFLIWQSDYTEYSYAPEYFPDFGPDKFEGVIKDYALRNRRFGK